jgi:hypothetical protein
MIASGRLFVIAGERQWRKLHPYATIHWTSNFGLCLETYNLDKFVLQFDIFLQLS